LLASGLFGKDEPLPIFFLLAPLHPRPLTPLISPNLSAYSESPFSFSLLVSPKQPLVKIEEVKDDDNEMFFLYPSYPKAGPLQYILPEFLPIIPQK